MPDLTIEILRNLQRELAAMNERMDGGFARLEGRMEMHAELAATRFAGIEAVLTEMSGRIFVGSNQFQSATTRHDRELAELRARVTKLEQKP